jgi:hypothetical protein
MNGNELEKLGHALDAGWLMALWLAIHGGDPPPQEQVIGESESLDLSALALVARLRGVNKMSFAAVASK